MTSRYILDTGSTQGNGRRQRKALYTIHIEICSQFHFLLEQPFSQILSPSFLFLGSSTYKNSFFPNDDIHKWHFGKKNLLRVRIEGRKLEINKFLCC